VQALGPTLFPCYAPADREIAQRIAIFLERGTDVTLFLEEGEIGQGEDLAAKAREGRMADVILVLFSRSSLPPRWSRAQWEEPLVTGPEAEGVRIGFVKCDDCVPPRVLQPCFDLTVRPSDAMREMKRWLRQRAASFEPPTATTTGENLEWLGIAIADRPGIETVERIETAYEFARAFRDDFDEIFHVECGGRSMAAVAGDFASQMGLRLEGDLPSNLGRLSEFVRGRRFLLLLESPQPHHLEELAVAGRCSILVSGEAGPGRFDALRQAQRALADGGGRAWPELCHLARQGRRITREQGRLAECFEMMQQWHEEAVRREDLDAADESAREMVWILEQWGRLDEAQQLQSRRATEFGRQLALPF
jgi:hypothetical protein